MNRPKFVPGSIKIDPEVAARRGQAYQEYWDKRLNMTLEEAAEEVRKARVRSAHQAFLCMLGFHGKLFSTGDGRRKCRHCGKIKGKKL
jgi:hypothetical protein